MITIGDVIELLREIAYDAGVIGDLATAHPALACAIRIRDSAESMLTALNAPMPADWVGLGRAVET